MSKYNQTVSNQTQVDALSEQDYWNISHVVTRLFTEAADASPPTDVTLRLLTTRLGWDVGGFWIVNELRMALECAAFYSHTPESFKNFETVSRARRLSFGEGLPGSAWKLRSVVCFPDLPKEENFPRLSVAALENLQSGVAFPLYVGKKVLVVVEFFSRERRALAPATEDFLFALGGQMGVFLERLSAGKSLEAANAQFLLVAEAASVAVFTIDDTIDDIIDIGKESNSLEEVGSGTIHAAQSVYTEYPDPRRDEWQTKTLPALKKLPVSALRLLSHKSRSMLYRARAGRSRPRIKNQKPLASILRRMEIA